MEKEATILISFKDDKEEIAYLKERLRAYEANPVADFYLELAKAAKVLQNHIADKTLNLKNDIYQMSVKELLVDADKIFSSMDKGKKSFEIAQPEEKVEAVHKKAAKSKTLPL